MGCSRTGLLSSSLWGWGKAQVFPGWFRTRVSSPGSVMGSRWAVGSELAAMRQRIAVRDPPVRFCSLWMTTSTLWVALRLVGFGCVGPHVCARLSTSLGPTPPPAGAAVLPGVRGMGCKISLFSLYWRDIEILS